MAEHEDRIKCIQCKTPHEAEESTGLCPECMEAAGEQDNTDTPEGEADEAEGKVSGSK